MNTLFNLNISTPCTENFDNFISTQNGGFCGSCQKEVIDFTKMNSQEITNYFQTKKIQDTCGRFYSNQLNKHENNPSIRKKISFFSGFGLALLSLFSFNKANTQDIENKIKTTEKEPSKFQSILNNKNIIVKGTVLEGTMPLPGASILLEGTTIGTSTDFDGNFTFPEKLKKGDVLVFSYVGFESKKVVITDNTLKLNVTLNINLKMDTCVLMGEVAVKKVYSSKKD